MKIVAVTFGSRGDTEPFVTLGVGLAAAGHDVSIVSHRESESHVVNAGLQFAEVSGPSMRDVLESPEALQLQRITHRPMKFARGCRAVLTPWFASMYEGIADALAGADAVLALPVWLPALDIARRRGAAIVHVHHVPMLPTTAFPAPSGLFSARNLSPIGNLASYGADSLLLFMLGRGAMSDGRRWALRGAAPLTFREALAQRRERVCSLVPISPHVLSRPSDWPDDAVICGYWWPQGQTGVVPPLDRDIVDFLAAGPPPLFVGFGSTLMRNPAEVTEMVVGAARDVGARLLLQRGWAGLGEGAESDDVHVIGDASYGALFDHVAAVVHHGGAGTTALGLRHGRPTAVLPAVADQFFWGHRVAALRVGPEPRPLRRVNRHELRRRFRALLSDSSFRTRGREIASRLREEDGVDCAVAAIERSVAERGHRRTVSKRGPRGRSTSLTPSSN